MKAAFIDSEERERDAIYCEVELSSRALAID